MLCCLCSVNKLSWQMFVSAFELLRLSLFLGQNVLPLILPSENKDLLLFHIMPAQIIQLN